VYGAEKVVLVVGAQKVTKDFDAAMKRIENYVFPLEDARALKAYGVHSNISKLLVISKEVAPDRITVVIAKEKLGY
ncbi:MAG TPA: hypothetical protein VJA40_00045, partial [archaeon]|nr:hypothetical protein [archaeon]